MIAELAALIVFYLLLLVDISNHNKKVDKQWPDGTDPVQSDMARRFRITGYPYYLFLVLLIGLLIKNIFF